MQPSHWKSAQLKIILPPTLAVVLTLVALFGIALPEYRAGVTEERRQSLQELVRTAQSLLAGYVTRVQRGELTQAEAQAQAIEQLRRLRYGAAGRDYFWINDLEPRMLMHPYRPGLEGTRLDDYTDPTGHHLFRDMVRIARQEGAGFVAYHWQWLDDPLRIEPKLSYVALFEPWQWVIGTGVYMQDLQRELDALSERLLWMALSMVILVALITAYIIRRGLRDHRRRLKAEAELRRNQALLEELVHQRTNELAQSQQQVETLSGLLPICANCKQIRDAAGQWSPLEHYIEAHSEAEFSHAICPQCRANLYG